MVKNISVIESIKSEKNNLKYQFKYRIIINKKNNKFKYP